MIWLTHPDKQVRTAILATIKKIWPEGEVDACAPDQLPEGGFSLALEAPALRLGELIGQIQTAQRQGQWPISLKFETTSGIRILNTRTREWQDENETIILTEKEVGVLLYLWQKKIPVTREDLLRDIWQYASDADTHTIETHIYRLRQKIETDPAEPEFLITGKDGYQLSSNARE
jgi:DNA-binding response OmpR family regulator